MQNPESVQSGVSVRSIFRRFAVLAAIGGAGWLTGCSGSKTTASSPPRNLLLVTLDTTRADHLSCYGHPIATTPNLDMLAREGARFDLAIAQAAVTPVSHASILTGLNPYQHGLRVLYAAKGYRLPSQVPTLSTILHDAGFRTAAFLSAFPVTAFFGFNRGFDLFDDGLQAPGEMQPAPGGTWQWNIAANQRRSDDTTDHAIGWLERQQGPFFAWIHYWDPHDDVLLPPEDVLARFLSPIASPRSPKGAYDAELYFVDQQFGRLLETLKKSGQYDRTIIVAVADHGEGLGDHDWPFHRILYQEQIRLPLIVRIPGGPSGKVVHELVRSVDILPTVLEALGIPIPGGLPGASLRGLMEDRPESPRIAYADALNLYDLNAKMLEKRPQDDLLYCAMDHDWKLIYRSRRADASELYDLKNDPHETTNLYARQPAQRERLLATLRASGGFVQQPFGPATDPEALERLRALGYVGDAPPKTPPPVPSGP